MKLEFVRGFFSIFLTLVVILFCSYQVNAQTGKTGKYGRTLTIAIPYDPTSIDAR